MSRRCSDVSCWWLIVGVCLRARVVTGAGVNTDRRSPRRGVVLTPARNDASSALTPTMSGPQLGCRVGCTRVRRSESGQARLPGIPSLTGWQHGALRPRPDGLKQFVDLAAGAGVMPITSARRVVSELLTPSLARQRISPSRRP